MNKELFIITFHTALFALFFQKNTHHILIEMHYTNSLSINFATQPAI